MSAGNAQEGLSAPRRTVLASKISHQVDLVDLRVTHLSTDLLQVPQLSPLRIGAKHELSWEHGEGALQYFVNFTLEVAEPETSDPDSEAEAADVPVFTSRMTLSVVYDFDGDPEDDDVYLAFGELSVMHTVYPYLRELVHTLTVRAGLPPLVMPSFLSPVLNDESEPAED